LSDERPESLLKSALEKIVYFEARSTQLSNDLDRARADGERMKSELAQAAQREIELRRVIAELEVRATRAHAEREEAARLTDALRRERADLIGKMLDASRIHGSDQVQGLDDFDLAQFIAQLRSEVLLTRDGPVVAGPSAPVPAPVTPAAVPPDARPADAAAPVADAPEAVQDEPALAAVTRAANELSAQGRLAVTSKDLEALSGAQAFPGRSEETLFGFSVRELSAPDSAARARAAERLKALAHPAAAPALAAALHAETEAPVQVALLNAFAALAKAEGVAVVQPLLASRAPDVRIAALKALLTLDAGQAGPHLAAAMSDPDRAVRRRASLLALGLEGDEALALGTRAIRDADADVRALAALVLGASQAEAARPLLLDAMRDKDLRVRRSASQALSKLLGRDVTGLVGLDDAQRRREVRRLAHVPAAKVDAKTVLAQRLAAGRPVTPKGTSTPAGAPSVLAQALHPVAASAHETSLPAAASPRALDPSALPAPAGNAVPVAALSHLAPPAPVLSATPVVAPAPSASSDVVASEAASRAVVESPAQQAVAVLARPSVQAQALAPAAARTAVAVLEVDDAPPPPSAALCEALVRELRAAIRGRALNELAVNLDASTEETMRACAALMQQGQVVRRGLKYFVA